MDKKIQERSLLPPFILIVFLPLFSLLIYTFNPDHRAGGNIFEDGLFFGSAVVSFLVFYSYFVLILLERGKSYWKWFAISFTFFVVSLLCFGLFEEAEIDFKLKFKTLRLIIRLVVMMSCLLSITTLFVLLLSWISKKGEDKKIDKPDG